MHHLISPFISILNAIDAYPDSEELADVIWLALQIDQPPSSSLPSKVPTPELDDDRPSLDPQDSSENRQTKSTDTSSTSQTQQQKSSLYPHKQNSRSTNAGLKAQPFRTPGLSLLPNALAFSRALRPLHKKVGSRFHTELAIDETIEQIAETKLFWPVLKGKPERWLELTLVIDTAVSMQIWQPLLTEFRHLLAGQGTFKKVYVYELDTENKVPRVMKNKRVVKNLEMIAPSESRLILVLSDCVAKAWHHHEGVFKLLQRWSQQHPVSIMQMLPARLWQGTALAYAEEARLNATSSLSLNQDLVLNTKDFWFVDDLSDLQRGFKIPILTLEPEKLKMWAKLVLGKQESWLKGRVFEHNAVLIPPLEQELEKTEKVITAEQRLKQFRRFASPVAQDLAAYLAAAPLDLSVMNLVQKLMLPQSQQVHLAEVFLGGLLKRVSDGRYEFHEGVQDLLLDTVAEADMLYVFTQVSNFVGDRIGQSLDFLALLANPALTEGIELNEDSQAFAGVAEKILRRLGGEYESIANRLTTQKIPQPKKIFFVKNKDILKKLYNAFDPSYPLIAGDPAYVDYQDVRGSRDIVQEIGRKIELSNKPTCQLYAGHRGAGKSTELLRLKQHLENNGYKVIYFLVDEKDISSEDTGYADILLACTRQLLQSLQGDKDNNPVIKWLKDRWDSLKDLATTDITIDEISVEFFVKVSANLRTVPSLRQKIRQQVEPHTVSLIEALNEFIDEATKYLPENQQGIVLIVDNLDRIVPVRHHESHKLNHDEIFLNRSGRLKSLHCHVIYTVPISIVYSQRASELEECYVRSVQILPMIKVHEHNTNELNKRNVDPKGINKLKAMIEKRIHKIDDSLLLSDIFETMDALEQLCLMSGGHIRNLVLLLRTSIERTPSLPIPVKAMRRAMSEMQGTYRLTVAEDEWKKLVKVYLTKQLYNKDDYRKLLFNRCILEYQEMDEAGDIRAWYDVHPLIEKLSEFQTAYDNVNTVSWSEVRTPTTD